VRNTQPGFWRDRFQGKERSAVGAFATHEEGFAVGENHRAMTCSRVSEPDDGVLKPTVAEHETGIDGSNGLVTRVDAARHEHAVAERRCRGPRASARPRPVKSRRCPVRESHASANAALLRARGSVRSIGSSPANITPSRNAVIAMPPAFGGIALEGTLASGGILSGGNASHA